MKYKRPKLEFWAQKYAQEYWGRSINHPVEWNPRLRAYRGCVKWKWLNGKIMPIKIEISPKTIEGGKQFHLTLKHELCHYFLLLDGIEHNEYSEVFLNELRRVGGSMPKRVLYWNFHCGGCGAFVYSAKRFQWNKFLRLREEVCSCKALIAKKCPIIEELT